MSAIATSSPRLERWLRVVAIAIATVALLILIAWLAVPPIVRAQLESRLSETLNRPTTVEEVAFDPFRLTVTLRNVAIGERTGPTFLLTIDEIVADLSSATIIHRAPVLDALRIVHPVLTVSRDAKGQYSVQDLVDRALEGPSGPPPRFSVNNIEIESGTLNFEDGVAQRKHTVDGLGMGIPFLSSLPYQTAIRVTPHVSGTFNGSHFGVEGSSVPFAERREATLDIDLDALPLAQYVAYLPSKPRYDLARGALTTRLKVAFVDGQAGEQRLDVRGVAQIDDLVIKHRDGAPLIAAQRIAAAIEGIDVFGHEARVALLALQGLSADVRRRPDGALELAQPWFDSAPARKADAQASPDKPWSVTVAKSTLAGGAVTLVDEGSQFRTELADVTADASNLSTKKGGKAHVVLSFVSADRIAAFKGEADVEPTVPTATGTFDLRKFSLPLLLPYYKDILNVEVQGGSADLAGSFALAADGNVKVTQGSGRIGDLRLVFPGAKAPLWRVAELVASGVEVDTSTRKVALADVAVHSGALRIARERDGTLEAARLMKTTKTTGTSADTQTWTLAFKKLAFDRVALDMEDRVPQPPVKLAGRETSLVLNDLSNARNAKATMSFRTRIGPRGQLSFAGPLTTNPFSIGGQLEASGLDLVPLKPYVEPHVNVLLTSGMLAAKGRLVVSVPDNASGTRATWNGNVSVTDFAALDRPTSSDLVRWKTLALDGLDVASEPFRVAIARIGAEDYYARLIVYQDGTVNLTRLLTPGAAPEPSAAATPEKLDKDAPARASEEPLPITIGKIEVARGNLNISDFFVRPNYSANLTDVTGTVSAMSKDQAGDIAIAARVDGTAPVEVKGRIQPFAKDIALDLAATARDVDLPPLTPYSIKYAGYGIEKGKLTFDVHYRIENRRLAADNRLLLDQLTFNRERVDSPTATKLPVLLAVALLKDSRGVIDLQLPISGTLDDPKFSMWGLIVQVIGNLIGKAATAPFALLTAAFGGHGEELSVVPFAAGSATLNEDAQKRMETLAKALGDRPALELEIAGRADLATDREALRHNAVDTAMKREKMKALVRDGSAPASLDLVTIGGDERSRWLKAAYEEAPIKSRPRNVIGILKEVPDGEMEATLLADAKVEDDAIRLLANARAQTVKDVLAAKGIAGERMFLLAPRLGNDRGAASAAAVTPAENAPPTRVDLALR